MSRLEPQEDKPLTSEEIASAVHAFDELMSVLEGRGQLKMEDLQELYNIEIYHVDTLNAESVRHTY